MVGPMDSGNRSIDDLHPLALRYRDILDDPARANQMASAALELGKPEAAKTLADMAEELGAP